MKKIVIMPGGFHPFHAGHLALYKSAVKAFPDADVYVAASDSQKERPFPFKVKQKLAQVAGIPDGKFVQVKSPFRPDEITRNYDATQDALIFVRSEKDRNESPKPGGTKKDGSPTYYQPYDADNLKPFDQQGYMAYLPTIQFAGGITSATEIRKAWPGLDELGKIELIKSMYPDAELNVPSVKKLVQMLDAVLVGELVTESLILDPNNKEALLEAIEHLDEVNLKKLAATVGLLGSLITPQIAQAYDVSDLRRMGFGDPEIRVMQQMPAADKASHINAKIDQLGGEDAVQSFHGRNYSYPKVDATTVNTQKPTGNARSGSNTRVDPTANVTPGSGDAEKLKKNARLLRDVLQADKRVSKHIKSVYYSNKVNKIVIIPKYDNYAYQSQSWINDKLGSNFGDQLVRKFVMPQVVKAVAKVGVPSLDMDNIMIVDRNQRAPMNETFVDPDQSKQYWNHDDQNVGVGMQIEMPLRDNDKRGRRQGFNEGEERSIIRDAAIDALVHFFEGHADEFESREAIEANIYSELSKLGIKDIVDPEMIHHGQRMGNFASGRVIDVVDGSSVIDEVLQQLNYFDTDDARNYVSESLNKIRGMIKETTDEQKSRSVDLHRKLFELMEEEKNNVVKLRGFGREADKKVVDIGQARAEKERDQERENNRHSERREIQDDLLARLKSELLNALEQFRELEEEGLLPMDMKDAYDNTEKLVDFIEAWSGSADQNDFPFTESMLERLQLKTVQLKEYFGGMRDTQAPRVLRKQEPKSSPFDFWNKIDLSETADYIEEK
tara:strand:- start:2754 stop:5096 length:2343 start_codon:yes stop_codon:yes gene_type:complete